MVKNLPVMQEMWVLSLGQKDPLQEEMATYSSISCQDYHIDRGAPRATAYGITGSDITEQLNTHAFDDPGFTQIIQGNLSILRQAE